MRFFLTTFVLVAVVGGCRKRPEPRTEIPEMEIAALGSEPLVIDGVLDEAAWDRADETGAFVDPNSGAHRDDSPVAAQARLLWDSQALYLAITVEDGDPSTPFGALDDDPHIWSAASGIELMLQPGDPGDNTHYYEIQVDVGGSVWDTRFDDYNQPRTGADGARRYGHQDWSSRMQRAVHIDGGADRYTIELALPWSVLASDRTAVPPEVGDVWRANLYSFRDGQRQALAWSAILGEGNFHRSARFGRLRFAAPM